MTAQLTGVNDPPSIGQQFPVDHPYAKGKAINLGSTTLAAAGTATADVATQGFVVLTVFAKLGNATTPAGATTDITIGVAAYEDDGVATFPSGAGAPLVADLILKAATLGSNMAYTAARYLVYGVDKVQVQLHNANAGALQGATLIYYLQK